MKIIAIENVGYGCNGVVVKLDGDEFEKLTGKALSEARHTTQIDIQADWNVLKALRSRRDITNSVAAQLEAYATFLRTETGARDVIDEAEAAAKAAGGAP